MTKLIKKKELDFGGEKRRNKIFEQFFKNYFVKYSKLFFANDYGYEKNTSFRC
jgi:hypothetical protein